jgi:hypothetical protein
VVLDVVSVLRDELMGIRHAAAHMYTGIIHWDLLRRVERLSKLWVIGFREISA